MKSYPSKKDKTWYRKHQKTKKSIPKIYFFFCLLLVFAFSINISAQSTVIGTVKDEAGNMLQKVSVNLKGTLVTTSTDDEGKYSIICPDLKGVLVFSSVGFATREVRLNGNRELNVELFQTDKSLDEVIVTGYSSQRKKDITGSVAIVDMKSMKSIPTGSAAEALQGMASGVNVIRSGVPGATSKILIRGVTNFGNTNPLIIVDGIEQDLNLISPQDIESFQVLKDGGAAAIYGVRGANGVILVTTKKGKIGAPVIAYEGSFGLQLPRSGNPYNLLNPDDYMKVYSQAFPGNSFYKDGMPDYTYKGPAGSGVAFEGDSEVNPALYFLEIPNKGKNYVIYKTNKEGTDWFHELYKKSPSIRQNVSASGGNDNARYLFSLGYLNEQGTLVKSYIKRYTARVNTEFNIGNNLRVGENINLIHTDIGGVYGSTAPYNLQSIIPVKDIMGNWAGSFGGPDLGQAGNPIAAQYRHENDMNYRYYILGSGYAELDILKKFTMRTNLGYNISNSYNQNFEPTAYEHSEANNAQNQLSINSGFENTMTFTNTLSYKNTFTKHNLAVLIGSEAIEYNGRNQSGIKKNFFSTDPNFLILNNGQEGMQNSSSINKNTLFSLFGKVDYSYDDKYLLSGTLRRDGSSRFGEGNKYGIFPSISLGWRMSEEEFMKNLTWLDELKIRMSYGVLGSQSNVDAQNQYTLFYSGMGYPDAADHYYDLAGTGNSAIQGFGVQRYGNTNTSWEENIISNIGIDVTMLKNKLDISIEYYRKSINGLLFTEPLPAIIGDAIAPKINIGNIQNSGVDFTAKYSGRVSNNFKYFIGSNITSYKNEVVNIPGPGYFDQGVVRNEEGYPISSFFGYKVIGLFNSLDEIASAPTQEAAAPGRFRYEDIDNDKKITPADRVHLGDPNPDFTYGINLGFEYENFDFSAFLYGSQGNQIYSAIRKGLDFIGYYPTWNKSNNLLNAWTPTNTNTNIPKVESVASFSTLNVNNSYYIENGSFLKLRSLVLGYTVNPTVKKGNTKKFQVRAYAQVANLFTLTKYSGIDPEVGGASAAFGIDNGGYPTDETNIVFGLSIKF